MRMYSLTRDISGADTPPLRSCSLSKESAENALSTCSSSTACTVSPDRYIFRSSKKFSMMSSAMSIISEVLRVSLDQCA
jgi:hypothetical protein